MDLVNTIMKALQSGEYGRGGTTGGMGAQRSANPGPMGAGDIPDPSLYEQTPYLVPTGGDTGLPDDFYGDPLNPKMKQALMSMGHDGTNFDTATVFSKYLSDGLDAESALRAAFRDAAVNTIRERILEDRQRPVFEQRRKDVKR
jgi:hypothetical protein